MGLFVGDGEDATHAQIQAALGGLLGERGKKASRGARKPKKLDIEGMPGVGLNQTIKIEIELPAYYVAGMRRREQMGELAYREAVKEYLARKGDTWWQPRFMAAIMAKRIEAAKARFSVGLE